MPLRKGSKGIPGKNVARLAGRPLYEWAFLELDFTSETRAVLAHDYDQLPGASWYDEYFRSPESATDDAPTDMVIREWLEAEMQHMADDAVFLLTQATNPWTTAEDFKRAVEFLKLADDPDGYVVGAAKCSPWIYAPPEPSAFLVWVPDVYRDQAQKLIDGGNSTRSPATPMFNRDTRGNRQSSGYLLKENGSIYCTTFGALRRNGPHKGNLVGIVEMPEYTALEIDEPHHLVQARALCEHYQCTPPELRNFIR